MNKLKDINKEHSKRLNAIGLNHSKNLWGFKMKKEETLSDRLWSVQKFEKISWKKRTKILFALDVKEFIKNLKDEIKEGLLNLEGLKVIKRIDKLAGKDLKWK